MGESSLRKTDKTLSKGEHVVVFLPGAMIEHVPERVEKLLGHGPGRIYISTCRDEQCKRGTTRIVQRYRQLVGKLKKTRVEQIILSGILLVGRGNIETARAWQSML